MTTTANGRRVQGRWLRHWPVWLASWLALVAFPASAIDFGTLRLYLPPGQPPYAEITVSAPGALDPADIRARIATPDAYGVAGMRYERALQQVVITPQAGSNGEVLLRLDRLPSPTDTPELDLLLLVGDRMSLALGEYRVQLQGSNREFAAAPAGSRLAASAPGNRVARGASSSPVTGATASAPTPLPATPVPEPARPEAQFPAVESAIAAWARAWSERDFDAYVAAYAPDYAGNDPKSTRAAWIEQRRSRIVPRRSISVDVSKLQLSARNDQVVATFVQNYKGDSFSERSRKRLVFQKIDNRWLIREESEL